MIAGFKLLERLHPEDPKRKMFGIDASATVDATSSQGVPDKQTWEVLEYAARMEAFISDPVYEGKSFAGMADMIKRGEIDEGNILYTLLGGQLALNT
ncbi:hypothetical protein PENDEC_c017G03491 [Penicillium decumbens]|uniref:Tryptophan synthase beta chain-like PALP domain-containing protein n=1 Tax=Penicillium decumbens TaxID=69771 RepID=A0A1V6P8R7_PENDC|nr:hypothetical protein PENDEC_c017G03491 [Penicillium decumbens]